MSSRGRCFPYERNIVKNALYDTIEALGLSLDSADSTQGVFVVSNPWNTGKMRILIVPGKGENQTQLEICPDNENDNCAETWRPIIIDELEGSIKRMDSIGRREVI